MCYKNSCLSLILLYSYDQIEYRADISKFSHANSLKAKYDAHIWYPIITTCKLVLDGIYLSIYIAYELSLTGLLIFKCKYFR